MNLDDLRGALAGAFEAALADLDPARLVKEGLPPLPPKRARVRVVAAGKAAVAMTRGAFELWGDRIADALVVSTEPEAATTPRTVVRVAGPSNPRRAERRRRRGRASSRRRARRLGSPARARLGRGLVAALRAARFAWPRGQGPRRERPLERGRADPRGQPRPATPLADQGRRPRARGGAGPHAHPRRQRRHRRRAARCRVRSERPGSEQRRRGRSRREALGAEPSAASLLDVTSPRRAGHPDARQDRRRPRRARGTRRGATSTGGLRRADRACRGGLCDRHRRAARDPRAGARAERGRRHRQRADPRASGDARLGRARRLRRARRASTGSRRTSCPSLRRVRRRRRLFGHSAGALVTGADAAGSARRTRPIGARPPSTTRRRTRRWAPRLALGRGRDTTSPTSTSSRALGRASRLYLAVRRIGLRARRDRRSPAAPPTRARSCSPGASSRVSGLLVDPPAAPPMSCPPASRRMRRIGFPSDSRQSPTRAGCGAA